MKLSLVALAISVSLVGCKAIDAMDNTDTMNKNLSAMKETTNGMAGTTNGLKGGMDEAIRLSKIADSKNELVKPENMQFYIPPPRNVLIAGKFLGENMHADELMDYFFASIKEFREMGPDSGQFDRRYVGNYAPEYVNKFNTFQMARGVGLQAIAGQIPQPMIEKLINEQVYDTREGTRPDTVMQILMLRAMFLSDFMLDKDAFRQPITTLGEAKVARDRLRNLTFISKLPFADQIKFEISTTAFLPKVNQAQLLPGDADYAAKCQQQTPADAACSATVSDFVEGLTTYNTAILTPDADHPGQNLPTLEVSRWKKLARAIAGYTDCKGKFHKGEVPQEQLGSNSSTAREFAEIEAEALRGFPAEVCPAK